MKKIFSLILLISTFLQAQNSPKAIQITYQKSANGSVLDDEDLLIVFADPQHTVVTSQKILSKNKNFPYEHFYLDRTKNIWHQKANLKPNHSIATLDTISLKNQKFTFSKETKKILGYSCQKATTIINSNTIDIWYTNSLNISAAPSILGQNLGLVLEITRNNNYSITATKVEKLKKIPQDLIQQQSSETVLDLLSYRDELWKSRFTTIPVFKDEIINFSEDSKSNDSIFRFAQGTVIIKKINCGKITSDSKVFVDLKEQSNGDAYDRTGSVFLIPMDSKITFLEALQKNKNVLPIYENGNGKKYQGVVKTTEFSPVIELMRFFTPFGISHFNTIQLKNKEWEDAVFYRQDISDLASLLNNNDVFIGVFIGNYDKGGHKISLNLTVHPENNSKAKSTKIIPLFNTLNVMEMAGQEYGTMFNSDKGLIVNFELEKDLQNAKLRYITTGHGGWENGDEFVPKANTILLNEQPIFNFIPWKTDCGSYRNYNPASGNFENGLSSSDYSRSNWCPATTTNPIFIELGNLKAGKHSVTIKIPQGPNEGTSFSSWNVSGILIGE